MLKPIKNFFTHLFFKVEYGDSLEQYIISKNPQTVYDVDYWTKQYDKKLLGNNL